MMLWSSIAQELDMNAFLVRMPCALRVDEASSLRVCCVLLTLKLVLSTVKVNAEFLLH